MCYSCSGIGFIFSYEDVIKYSGIFDVDGVEVKVLKIRNELVKRVCGVCGGKKVIYV